MQRITLEALEVLDAIDAKGSFAAAGQFLNKVPSAITYTVQKLEEDLEVTLFVKEGRRSVLTPAGQVLLDQGREILDASARLSESVRQVDSGWESALNIVIDTALGIDHVYPYLQELFTFKPDIEVNLYEEALGGGWEALESGKVDLALGLPANTSNKSMFQCMPYEKRAWGFYCVPEHPLASLAQPISKLDIECYRAIVVRDSAQHHAGLNIRLFSKQPCITVPSVGEKLKAQLYGLGVGFLPESLAEEYEKKNSLVRLDVEGVEPDSTLHMAWRRGKKGRALSWLIEQLKQHASKENSF